MARDHSRLLRSVCVFLIRSSSRFCYPYLFIYFSFFSIGPRLLPLRESWRLTRDIARPSIVVTVLSSGHHNVITVRWKTKKKKRKRISFFNVECALMGEPKRENYERHQTGLNRFDIHQRILSRIFKASLSGPMIAKIQNKRLFVCFFLFFLPPYPPRIRDVVDSRRFTSFIFNYRQIRQTVNTDASTSGQVSRFNQNFTLYAMRFFVVKV